MKEPYAEGLASHSGLESCIQFRNELGEALTEVHAGQPLSRENEARECRHALNRRKATSSAALLRAAAGLPAVRDPAHA